MSSKIFSALVLSWVRTALATVSGALIALGVSQVDVDSWTNATQPILVFLLMKIVAYLTDPLILTGVLSYVSAQGLSFLNAIRNAKKWF